MKRVLIALGVVFAMLIAGLGTYFVSDHFHKKETEQLNSQIATLTAEKAAIGEIVDCYTVLTETYPGQVITEDILTKASIPSSFKNDSFASHDDIVGLLSKVAITPGTPITKDMIMSEAITDSLREVDLTANRWPVGLKVGDYVDLRLTYPDGEDFIVLSHKRVQSITDQTLKMYITEEENHLWQAALVDFYITYYSGGGSDLYFSKYVEPGIQEPAVAYYSVPQRIATVCLADPNIVDTAMVTVKENLRTLIDESIAGHYDPESVGDSIASGREELNGRVNADYGVDAEEQEEQQEQQEQQQQQEEEGGDSLITEPDGGAE